MLQSLLFFVLSIEEPLRGQKKRKREKELEKKEGTHNTLFIQCHTFLKEQDFVLSCDTRYQISFFSFIFITEEPSGTEQKRQKVKKKMTEGTLHSLL